MYTKCKDSAQFLLNFIFITQFHVNIKLIIGNYYTAVINNSLIIVIIRHYKK